MTQFDKVLRKWLKANGLGNIKVCEDFDFYADTTDEIAYYGWVEDDDKDEVSMLIYHLAEELGMKVDCGIFVLSLLHEVGHIMTDDFWNDEDSDRFEQERDACCEMENMIEAQKIYVRIGDELMATQWAVDFINAHEDAVLTLKATVEHRVPEYAQ